MKKTGRLKRMLLSHQGDGLIRAAGAHNPLGAKLVQSAGFDAVWASGLEISAAQAMPDANILTMTEFLQAAAAMNDAVDLPVIADCDTGFGNSNNVIHMVKKYETAGIAAVCIEDKHFPKRNSLLPGRQELASIAEFVGKIMGAKNAQTDPDFMVIARVEALIAGHGMDEALKRAHAYADAGADAILIHSKSRNPDEILEFAGKWEHRAPLVVVPTTYYSVTLEQLQDAGVKLVIYANQGMRSAIRAMKQTFSEIYRTGSTRTVEEKIAPLQEIFNIQNLPDMREDEKRFLRTGQRNITAVIPVAGDHLEEHSMKEISADIPIAALDINGKPFLQRQVETLHRAGLHDIHVIAGYKKEKILTEQIQTHDNDDYTHTGILHSVMCARDALQGDVLIVYGDILFDQILLEQFFQVEADIAILVDPEYGKKNHEASKIVDLVICDGLPVYTKRRLRGNALARVLEIGPALSPSDAHYEFPGLMMLSSRGSEIFRRVYDSAKAGYRGKPFHSAQGFEQAGLSDLLQEIIDQGYPVMALESHSGWLEVHSLEDYKLACSMAR